MGYKSPTLLLPPASRPGVAAHLIETAGRNSLPRRSVSYSPKAEIGRPGSKVKLRPRKPGPKPATTLARTLARALDQAHTWSPVLYLHFRSASDAPANNNSFFKNNGASSGRTGAVESALNTPQKISQHTTNDQKPSNGRAYLRLSSRRTGQRFQTSRVVISDIQKKKQARHLEKLGNHYRGTQYLGSVRCLDDAQ